MRKAKYKSADVAELKKYYSYDYREGSLILNKTNRIMNLSIDESGRLKIKVNNKFTYLLAIEFAYALHTGEFCKQYLVPKDLDYTNLKSSNFLLLKTEDYKKLIWLLTNLRKHCKVLPNAANVHKASVKLYTWERSMKTLKFESYETACKYVRRIKLKLYRQLEQLGIDVNSKFLYLEE